MLQSPTSYPVRRLGLRNVCLALSLTQLVLSGAGAQNVRASDWPQFRGPGAHGRSAARGLPLIWSDNTNIFWKTALPGPGASSPIVIGDRIVITCFSGFATSPQEPGDMANLKRHLLSLNAADGKIVWDSQIPAALPEQERIRENHGYASSTPVAGSERIYAFFGKSGVFAFDHKGKQIWHTKVGDKLNGWGSATSPVLYRDFVIVNASIESDSLVALDKRTGKEVWRAGGVTEWSRNHLVWWHQARFEPIHESLVRPFS